jgi:hypothetical protein
MLHFERLNADKLKVWYGLYGAKLDIRFIYKPKSWIMQVIAFFLGIVHFFNKNVTSRREFLDDFTTTLYGRVYTSYDVREIQDATNLNGHIPHIIHEARHVMQFREHPIMMPLKYVFSKFSRAMAEAECFATHLEYIWNFASAHRSEEERERECYGYITKVLEGLRNDYGISPAQLERAQTFLNARVIMLATAPKPLYHPVVGAAIEVLRDIGVADAAEETL